MPFSPHQPPLNFLCSAHILRCRVCVSALLANSSGEAGMSTCLLACVEVRRGVDACAHHELVSGVEEGRVRGARRAQGVGRHVGAFRLAQAAMCEEVVLGMMTGTFVVFPRLPLFIFLTVAFILILNSYNFVSQNYGCR